MDRVDIYIQIVTEQPILLAPIIAFIFAYALVPSHRRLFVSLLILVPWLTVARSPGMGPLASAAKLTSGIAYLLIAFAAWTHPGPKRKLPGLVWLFVIIAVIAVPYVFTTQERMLAIILRMQWLTVTLAGALTVQTIVSYSDLNRITQALTWGCVFALIIPFSSLVLFPADSFLRGMGRFQPWGANSNQIGMLFAMAVPLFAYAAMTWRSSLKSFFLSALVLTVGMALLTASRQTMLAITLVMLPVIFTLTKRPIFTIFALALGLMGISFILTLGEAANFERFGSLETGRLDIWSAYLSEVFPSRPIFGLLLTKDESYFKALYEVGMHPHNAWFYLMYVGGISIAGPMLYLTLYSTFAGYKVWKVRKLLPGNSLYYSILLMLLLAMYIQGIFNQVVYWPTYSWSFLHVVIAGIFICMYKELKDSSMDGMLFDDTFVEYDEGDTEEEPFQNFSQTV
ncbi:MAG: hypothetical protein VX615_04510 [Planctomycetota bacterium]|nr:hypothetical protein [Planctomycetota bacterium]